jgi:hypothetical protein
MQGTVTKDNRKDSNIIYRLYMVNDFSKIGVIDELAHLNPQIICGFYKREKIK